MRSRINKLQTRKDKRGIEESVNARSQQKRGEKG